MKSKYLAMVPALALLAACGGSATNTNIYSDTLGNPSTAFANGLVLKATAASAAQINLDWTNDKGERITQLETPSFSLEKGDGNLVTMKVNGLSYEFTTENSVNINEDGTYSALVNENAADNAADSIYVSVYSRQGMELSELLDGSGTKKSAIVEYMEYNSNTPENGVFGVAVLGATTNPTALGEFTTINYEGNFRGETTTQDSFSNRLTRFEIRGDTTLIANFEQNTISGNITNLSGEQFVENEESSLFNMDGSFLLQEGNIIGSSFSGVATTDAALKTSGGVVSDDMNYSGNFYGDRGTEASGIVKGTIANADGSEDNFTGSFRTLPVPD
ncbi:transferrin-binding protein-like solute binding protein [Planktomarina temperata]|nr:transferrin-binding protein-like solute binding protein [Planktomarina temperata]